MLSFLRGKLVVVEKEAVVVEVNGLGFSVHVPASTLARLPAPGAEVKLHTHLAPREDGLFLYGFWEREELEIFRTLLNVNGVGPKAAAGLLSFFGPQRLQAAIARASVEELTRAPGIGKKTAQRIVLELKDKLAKMFVQPEGEERGEASRDEEDAVAALAALGYPEGEAKKAVRSVLREAGEPLAAGQLVRLALRKIGAAGG
ncbi:MAG: Holliday junction branch migration protein RuvA [Desulfotomaculales bacterium]